MSYDPDEFDDKIDQIADAEKLLAKLQDCDLGEWDQDFVDDMVKRIDRWGSRTTITGSQWEQLERMRTQYHVKD